jgi:hypothetical protein
MEMWKAMKIKEGWKKGKEERGDTRGGHGEIRKRYYAEEKEKGKRCRREEERVGGGKIDK